MTLLCECLQTVALDSDSFCFSPFPFLSISTVCLTNKADPDESDSGDKTMLSFSTLLIEFACHDRCLSGRELVAMCCHLAFFSEVSLSGQMGHFCRDQPHHHFFLPLSHSPTFFSTGPQIGH